MRSDYIKAPNFTDALKNTRKISIALDYVYSNKCTGVVAGVSGCGKTTALKNYQKLMNGVIYIQADATKWSPCSVLKLIAKSMETKSMEIEPKGSASDILDNLVDKLTGTDRLSLTSLEYTFNGVEHSSFINSVKYLNLSGYVEIKNRRTKKAIAFSESEYEETEISLTAKGIRILCGAVDDECIET